MAFIWVQVPLPQPKITDSRLTVRYFFCFGDEFRGNRGLPWVHAFSLLFGLAKKRPNIMAENKCESSSAFRRPALQGQIPVAVKIMHDHMFDHLRIFLCFYVLGIAVFSRKIKNSFSLFTAYQILRGDD